MLEFLHKLFASDFMPHGYCYLWKPGIVWLHVASDATITLAYYLIPVALFYFVRKRRDLPFNWMFVMFAVFILGCGTTHLMEVWTVWHGTYRFGRRDQGAYGGSLSCDGISVYTADTQSAGTAEPPQIVARRKPKT